MNLKFEIINKKDLDKTHNYLLNHRTSMTLKLEEFYKEKLNLKVLKSKKEGNIFKREIILISNENIPREFAIIKFYLNNLDKTLLGEVISNKIPFGKILTQNKIQFKINIIEFFKISLDNRLKNILKSQKSLFYGRKYKIFDYSNKILSDVIEIVS